MLSYFLGCSKSDGANRHRQSVSLSVHYTIPSYISHKFLTHSLFIFFFEKSSFTKVLLITCILCRRFQVFSYQVFSSNMPSLLLCHKKSYVFDEISKLEISKYYELFVYFQAAVSALLAVSVLYFEK